MVFSSDREILDTNVVLRVSRSERAEIEAMATFEGVNTSELIRRALDLLKKDQLSRASAASSKKLPSSRKAKTAAASKVTPSKTQG